VNTFDELNKKFEMEPEEPKETSVVPATPVTEITSIETDTETARLTMHGLLSQGNEAIEGILNIAKNSDHPRAYEVAGQLIKTVSEVAKDLLEVQKRKKDLNKGTEESSDTKQNIQTQNNLFVGSTTDLLKALKHHNMEILPAREE